MPLPDLSLLPKVEIVVASATFTDPRCPGTEFPFTFGFIPFENGVDLAFWKDRADSLFAKYVTGNLPVTVKGGARVPIEMGTCYNVSAFMMAEQATGTEDLTDEKDWFRLSLIAPTVWQSVNRWYAEQDKAARGASGTEDEESDGEPQDEATAPN